MHTTLPKDVALGECTCTGAVRLHWKVYLHCGMRTTLPKDVEHIGAELPQHLLHTDGIGELHPALACGIWKDVVPFAWYGDASYL